MEKRGFLLRFSIFFCIYKNFVVILPRFSK